MSRTLLICVAAVLSCGSVLGGEFDKPVRLKAAGMPIDTAVGHAAPYIDDVDKDGKRDLLVGQFGQGRLKIYLNRGTEKSPRYEAGTWFQAGGKIGSVPTG